MVRTPKVASLFVGLSLIACNGVDNHDGGGIGGELAATGGAVNVGGSSNPVTSSGGATQTSTGASLGGAVNATTTGTEMGQAGSSPSAGGATSTTSTTTGGTSSNGGTKATGGASSNGGTKATGGTTNTGGTKSTGGTKATGGASGNGGSTATGGTKATGGTVSTGGSTATGPGTCSVYREGATGSESGGLIPVCCTPSSPESTSIAEVFSQLNAHRIANGLSALAYDNSLETTIQGHCVHMSTHTFFEHTAPETVVKGPGERLKICAPTMGGTWGENIAQGQKTPTAVMTAWKNSAGHNANMLGANYTKVGIGYVTANNYWGQVFSK